MGVLRWYLCHNWLQSMTQIVAKHQSSRWSVTRTYLLMVVKMNMTQNLLSLTHESEAENTPQSPRGFSGYSQTAPK